MRKVLFDIKFRPEIESGELKVTTQTGIPVTILKWDMQGNYPILGVAMTEQTNYEGDKSWDEERPFAYSADGHCCGSALADKRDLILVDEKADIPAFEQELSAMLEYARNHAKPDANVVEIFKDRIYEHVRREIMD